MSGYLFFKVFQYIFDLFDIPPKKEISELRKYEIMYYSDGKLLPNPFYIEYKMIANTVVNSWIYEEQWQDLVNKNLDAPIVEIEIKQPFNFKYFYTFKHVFLANKYLSQQNEYLGNLN